MTITLESPATPTPDTACDVWAVYLRRSEADDDAGVLRHRKRGTRFCEDNGYAAEFYVDNDRPASEGSAPRRDYLRMLAGIKSGRIHGVWVFEQSRLTRDNDESNAFMRIAKTHHVLVAVKERVYDLTRATDRHTFRADANDATMEVERTSERLAEMFEDVIDTDGRAWWPCRPFGFEMPTTDKEGERVPPTLREGEAKLIEQAYNDILRGRHMRAIAREWNEAGVRTPTRRIKKKEIDGVIVPAHTVGGQTWTGNAIRKLLMNPRNAKLRERLHTEKQNGQRVILKREILPVEAEWPRIVSEELYYGVAAILEGQKRGPNKWARKYLMSGLARCGKCGERMTSAVQRQRPSYVCGHCGGVTRSVADVDGFVKKFIGNFLRTDDAKDLCHRANLDPAHVKAVNAKIAALIEVRKSQNKQAIDLAITAEEAEENVAEINAKIAALKAEIREPASPKALEDVLDADDPRQYFLDAPLDRQRAIIDFIATFTIRPGQAPRGAFNEDLIIHKWNRS